MNRLRVSNFGAQFGGQMLVIGLPTVVYIAALLFDPSRTLVLWERAVPPALPMVLLALGLVAHGVIALAVLARLPATLSSKQICGLLGYVFVAGVVLQTAATHIVEPFPLRGLAFRQYSDFTGATSPSACAWMIYGDGWRDSRRKWRATTSTPSAIRPVCR